MEEHFAIKTVNLKKFYGKFLALNNINLNVEYGCFYGFLGHNGAGKSTTIKILTGVYLPSFGEVFVFGKDIKKYDLEIKSKIGVVPEELNLFPDLTSYEHLLLTGKLYGLSGTLLFERVEELIDFFELPVSKTVNEYSHGMKKKLSLAIALIHQPEILFLDEPFEGIDAVMCSSIKEMLLKLTRQNVTIFLTSHVLEIVEKLCSKVAIINQGEIVAHGTIEGIKQKIKADSLEEVFIKTSKNGKIKKNLSWLE